MRATVEQHFAGGDDLASLVERRSRQAAEARRAPEVDLDRERRSALGEQRLAVELEVDPRRYDAADVGLHPHQADGQPGGRRQQAQARFLSCIGRVAASWQRRWSLRRRQRRRPPTASVAAVASRSAWVG